MRYGALPADLGLINLKPVEMMFWMYLPISTPRESVNYPCDNLFKFAPIVNAVAGHDPDRFQNSYVYLTIKTLWVAGDCIGNRPGWHSDGFGTDDANYIWYDRAPTEFIEDDFELPPNCENAMAVMADRACRTPRVTFPSKHLLALTPAVIHRSPVIFDAGMRTFVKVSVSSSRYNLEGNSINYRLRERWELLPREAIRNHPAKVVS